MVGTIGASKPGIGSSVLTLEQITAMETFALDSLTERKLEVLGLIANGDSNQSIAEKLGIEPITVDRHINGIYSKLPFDEGVDKRVKAVLMYRERYPFEFVKQQVEVNLTPREYEVLSYIAEGYSNSGISKRLHIKPKTLERHINGIYSKLPFDEGININKRVMAMMMFDRIPAPSDKEAEPNFGEFYLTERKLEVLGLIANGDSNQSIAEKLGIEPITVDRHINGIYSKLPFDEGVDKRVKAVLMYRERYPFEFVKQQVEVNLTPRQYEVLSLMAQGYSNSGIAEKLGIKPKTLERHTDAIYSKLPFDEGVDKRVIAALMYYRTPYFLSSQPTPPQPS